MPAAQRCARITVLSIICNISASPPLSAKPSSITSNTPDSAQRRNCLQMEFQLPNSDGRSRQAAPVLAFQNTPSNTRRCPFGGRPVDEVRKGSKAAHSSSDISPRATANLQR
jgi:hypothetical protein